MRVRRLAAQVRAVGLHRRKLFAELEALALLAAGGKARALENPGAQGAAQLAGGRPAEEDRGRAFAQRRDADLGARLAVDEAPLQRGEHDVLARELPGALGRAARVEDEQGGPAAQLADELARLALRRRGERQEKSERGEPHSGVSRGTRRCQSVACW